MQRAEVSTSEFANHEAKSLSKEWLFGCELETGLSLPRKNENRPRQSKAETRLRVCLGLMQGRLDLKKIINDRMKQRRFFQMHGMGCTGHNGQVNLRDIGPKAFHLWPAIGFVRIAPDHQRWHG